MYDLLWLVPALPCAGFLILALFGDRMPRPAAAFVGAGSVGLSALVAFGIAFRFFTAPPEGHHFTQVLWTWMDVDGFTPRFALYLDALSLVMILVVSGVGFLIHVYSAEYMIDDESYAKFFAYMNLFVAAMLMLVLGDNLVLLYLGWEGVGLCSFLLIGFWYKNPANGAAAMKAFLTTRIGDTFMAIGLFLIFLQLGTLDIQSMGDLATKAWQPGSGVAIAAALLLLGGAVGKSGQLPLQVWLPDAMAGPTPVSALIHAATMVTAGVYLIARTHVIFELAPPVQFLVAVIGAITLLLAGFAALVQRDIKRVLAYSTISQIGYMFLALGVGAYAAGIFHLVTHAFFKALLFMASGAVIVALHHEQDMFKMGGLRKKLPVVFWTFLIGSMSLASLPLISSGFYSKDLILWSAFASEKGSKVLWLAGFAGAFITGIYTFRMVIMTFFGEEKTHVHKKPGWVMCPTAGGACDLCHVCGAAGNSQFDLPFPGLHHVHGFRVARRADPARRGHGAHGTPPAMRGGLRGTVRTVDCGFPLWYEAGNSPQFRGHAGGRQDARFAAGGLGFRLGLRQDSDSALSLGGARQQERFCRFALERYRGGQPWFL